MKPILSSAALAIFLVGLSGCSNRMAEPSGTMAAPGARQVAEAGFARSEKGLSPQTLSAGECGLFLWTRREEPSFIFFSKGGTETAKFWYEGGEKPLMRTGVGGDIFGQQLTSQVFQLPDGRSVELSMEPGELLVGGQRVPEASFRIIDAEGWATMLPAAGVTVCQPEPQ